MKIVIAGGKAKADYLIRLLNGKGHQLIVINDDFGILYLFKPGSSDSGGAWRSVQAICIR